MMKRQAGRLRHNNSCNNSNNNDYSNNNYSNSNSYNSNNYNNNNYNSLSMRPQVSQESNLCLLKIYLLLRPPLMELAKLPSQLIIKLANLFRPQAFNSNSKQLDIIKHSHQRHCSNHKFIIAVTIPK